ncbi:hypothetical protein ANO14919_041340 [Xylariales sp. No.14919]|nr:hypothetical protein ANO14919_041340 [Xylariales sp. No.14919]
MFTIRTSSGSFKAVILSWSGILVLDSQLIVGKPLANICHSKSLACATIQESYNLTIPDPYTAPSASCTLGNLASYPVDGSSANNIQAAISFEKNIHVSIKNTGHGYLRRSAGKGSLALRTYNLKDISFSNYSSAHYTGPAVKLGAGVQAFEAYKSVFRHRLRVTGGYRPALGLVGDWVSGGGRGTSSSLYRLSADNNLEYNVVTTERKHLVASPSKNYELF